MIINHLLKMKILFKNLKKRHIGYIGKKGALQPPKQVQVQT